MKMNNIVDFASRDEMTNTRTELLRLGAQDLIVSAVEAEFASSMTQCADLRTDTGTRQSCATGIIQSDPFKPALAL